MGNTINIKYPKSLANSLKMNIKEFETEIKTSALVKLFERGKISSGTASKVLGISRLDFIELLSKYGVSPLGDYTANELSEDIVNA